MQALKKESEDIKIDLNRLSVERYVEMTRTQTWLEDDDYNKLLQIVLTFRSMYGEDQEEFHNMDLDSYIPFFNIRHDAYCYGKGLKSFATYMHKHMQFYGIKAEYNGKRKIKFL